METNWHPRGIVLAAIAALSVFIARGTRGSISHAPQFHVVRHSTARADMLTCLAALARATGQPRPLLHDPADDFFHSYASWAFNSSSAVITEVCSTCQPVLPASEFFQFCGNNWRQSLNDTLQCGYDLTPSLFRAGACPQNCVRLFRYENHRILTFLTRADPIVTRTRAAVLRVFASTCEAGEAGGLGCLTGVAAQAGACEHAFAERWHAALSSHVARTVPLPRPTASLCSLQPACHEVSSFLARGACAAPLRAGYASLAAMVPAGTSAAASGGSMDHTMSIHTDAAGCLALDECAHLVAGLAANLRACASQLHTSSVASVCSTECLSATEAVLANPCTGRLLPEMLGRVAPALLAALTTHRSIVCRRLPLGAKDHPTNASTYLAMLVNEGGACVSALLVRSTSVDTCEAACGRLAALLAPKATPTLAPDARKLRDTVVRHGMGALMASAGGLLGRVAGVAPSWAGELGVAWLSRALVGACEPCAHDGLGKRLVECHAALRTSGDGRCPASCAAAAISTASGRCLSALASIAPGIAELRAPAAAFAATCDAADASTADAARTTTTSGTTTADITTAGTDTNADADPFAIPPAQAALTVAVLGAARTTDQPRTGAALPAAHARDGVLPHAEIDRLHIAASRFAAGIPSTGWPGCTFKVRPFHQLSDASAVFQPADGAAATHAAGIDLTPQTHHLFRLGAVYHPRIDPEEQRRLVPSADGNVTVEECAVAVPAEGGGHGQRWLTQRMGPFQSTGGYDWWRTYWHDVFALGRDGAMHAVTAWRVLPTDASGHFIGSPPLHEHHVVVHPHAPSTAPSQHTISPVACILGGACPQVPVFFGQGDYAGLQTYHEVDDMVFDQPLWANGVFNDVRPLSSAPMVWYLQLSLRAGRPSGGRTTSCHAVVHNGNVLHFVAFTQPTHADTFWYSVWRMPYAGTLVHAPAQSPVSSFHTHPRLQLGLLFAARPEELRLPRLRECSGLGECRLPLTGGAGFASNAQLLAHVRRAGHVEPCHMAAQDQLCGALVCDAWHFHEGEVLTGLGLFGEGGTGACAPEERGNSPSPSSVPQHFTPYLRYHASDGRSHYTFQFGGVRLGLYSRVASRADLGRMAIFVDPMRLLLALACAAALAGLGHSVCGKTQPLSTTRLLVCALLPPLGCIAVLSAIREHERFIGLAAEADHFSARYDEEHALCAALALGASILIATTLLAVLGVRGSWPVAVRAPTGNADAVLV